MATYKPIRKTANGTEEIKIPYAVLADPPTIPTAISNLTNDSGFITSDGTVKSVVDYGDTTKNIKIGYSGSGITDGNIKYIAGYTTDDGTTGNVARIKNVSKDALKSWLGYATVATSGSYNDLLNTPAAVTESTVSGWGFTKNTGTVTSVQANGTNFNPDATGKVDLGNIGGGSGPIQFSDTVVMTEAEFSQAYLAGTLREDKLYLIEGETGTVNFVSTADHIVYNNANSGLTATNLQGAVDEINSKLFSGSYNDLTDKPTLFSGSYNDLTDKPAALTRTDILTLLNLTEEQLTKLIALLNKLTVDTTSVKFNDTTVKATTFDVQ